MKQLLPLIIIFLFLASCGRSKNTTASTLEQYDLTQAVSGSLADVFSDVELTPLQYGGEGYPKSAFRLQMGDSVIVVSDGNMFVHIFDKDGAYISDAADRMGSGPEEFSFALGFNWNESSNSLEILSPSKMSIYDKNLNYIKSIKLPTYTGDRDHKSFYIADMYSLSDSVHLVYSGTSENPRQYYKLSSETGELKEIFDYSDDVVTMINMQRENFFKMPDGEILFIPSAVTYNIYSFNSEDFSIEKCIGFSLGDHSITPEFMAKQEFSSPADEFQYIMESEKPYVCNVLPTTNKIVFFSSTGSSDKNLSYVFADRNTGKMVHVKMYDDNEYKAPMFKNVGEGYAYSVVGKEEILERPALLLDKRLQADSLLYDVEDDTFVLLKYKFKENL